jgi:sugar-specific transcriptional regulator TrmB
MRNVLGFLTINVVNSDFYLSNQKDLKDYTTTDLRNTMQPLQDSIQTLVRLGLSSLQAKTYLSLAKYGPLSGREAAKIADIASQDVYRILTELQEKGLVEKIIARPNVYKAVPLRNGLLMLVQQRNEQTIEIKKAVFKTIKWFENIGSSKDKNVVSGDFMLIPPKEPVENRMAECIQTAEKSIDMMNECQEGMNGHEIIFELEKGALERGVKIRDILAKTDKKYSIPKKFEVLNEWKLKFQVRYCRFPAPAILLIKDNKEALISTVRAENLLAQPYFWSNNRTMLNVIQQWYETIWNDSEKS